MNPFGMLAGLEDLVLLGLLMRALRRFRREYLQRPVIVWAILFVVIWSALYGVISSHNLGAAVRFRLQILPVFLLLLIYLGKPHPERAT